MKSIIERPTVNREAYIASEVPSKARKPRHTIVLPKLKERKGKKIKYKK